MPPSKNTAFKKAAVIAISLAGIVVLALLSVNLFKSKGRIAGYSGLSADSIYGKADAFIDGEKIGTTPIDAQKIDPGNHTLKLKGVEQMYETSIHFTAGSQVIVNRDLGVSTDFSSGQNFWFDSKDLSSKINVISDPPQAAVFIDDVEVGKTPYSSTALTDGEYNLKISKAGYETQNARIKIQKNFKLNVSIKLFLLPVSDKPVLLENSKVIYDLSSDNNSLVLDIPAWVKGASYWIRTRNVIPKYAYFLDYLGNIYDPSAKLLSSADPVVLKEGEFVGYLGRKSDQGMSKEASAAAVRISGAETSLYKVQINKTALGWLRVRSAAGLNSTEIGRLNSGDQVDVLKETKGWLEVRMPNGTNGWISGSYVTKVK